MGTVFIGNVVVTGASLWIATREICHAHVLILKPAFLYPAGPAVLIPAPLPYWMCSGSKTASTPKPLILKSPQVCFIAFLFWTCCLCLHLPGVYLLFSSQGIRAFIRCDGANIPPPAFHGPQVLPLWQWTQGHNSALWGTRNPGATSQLEGSCRGSEDGWRYPLLRFQFEGSSYPWLWSFFWGGGLSFQCLWDYSRSRHGRNSDQFWIDVMTLLFVIHSM